MILMVIAIWGLGGCGSFAQKNMRNTKKTHESPAEIMEKYTRKIARKPHKVQLPPLADLKPQPVYENKMPYEVKLFSLSARGTPLRDVLLGLAQEADLNLVLAKGVNPNELVSIEVHNLQLIKALDILLSSHQYFYSLVGNILQIKAVDTRIFNFDYPLFLSTSESSVGGDMLGGSSDDNDSDIAGEFTIETEIEDDSLDIWQQIEDAMQPGEDGGLLSPDGQAQINRMSGVIVITDRRYNLELVEKYLARVQEAIRRQVVIEAKIIEVTLSDSFQYGIDWNILSAGLINDSDIAFSTPGFVPSHTIGSEAYLTAANTAIAAANDPDNAGLQSLADTLLETAEGMGSTGSITPVNLLTFWGDTSGNTKIEGFLDALGTQGDVNVLSSPRLNVINNQTAMINVGRLIPFLDIETVITEVGDNLATTMEPTITYIQSGVSLGVTPQIDKNGITTMHITPIITSIVDYKPFNYNGTTWDIPISDVRETDTVVRIKDGATIVIGGLIQEQSTDNVSKIPLIGDIPFLGETLFSKISKTTQKIELVIMLKITVVDK